MKTFLLSVLCVLLRLNLPAQLVAYPVPTGEGLLIIPWEQPAGVVGHLEWSPTPSAGPWRIIDSATESNVPTGHQALFPAFISPAFFRARYETPALAFAPQGFGVFAMWPEDAFQ